MSRIKNAEQTKKQILDTTTRLFINKGYDNTSIQDIINELDISKGAIYHHFKSKEDLLECILQRRNEEAKELLDNLISNTKAKNAKEKLQIILLELIRNINVHNLDSVLSSQIKNPQFVVAGVKNTVLEDAKYLSRIFVEGIEDGSIKTEYPLESAEMFILLLNIWLNPTLFNRNLEETEKRVRFLSKCLKELDMDIVNEDLITQILVTYKNMEAFK